MLLGYVQGIASGPHPSNIFLHFVVFLCIVLPLGIHFIFREFGTNVEEIISTNYPKTEKLGNVSLAIHISNYIELHNFVYTAAFL